MYVTVCSQTQFSNPILPKREEERRGEERRGEERREVGRGAIESRVEIRDGE